MSLFDVITLVSAIAVSFGGGAVIVIALSSYLGDIWAKRILQKEYATLQRGIEEVKHDLSLEKSSYEHYLELILDYYRVFYRHYRLCQRTASADAHRDSPDSPIVYTQDEFLVNLDQFLVDWAEQEGRIRLLLPSKLLELHGEAIQSFNEFKRVVMLYRPEEEQRQKKYDAFKKIDAVKQQLEHGLRAFLRTEKLLK